MIRFESVRKTYPLGRTRVVALDDLSFEISAGEFTALAGPSGSGKTTLLNLAGCLDRPDSGRIWLAGEEITAIPLPALARTRRKQLGFVFQSFNLIPVLSAFENVEFPLVLDGVSKSERQQRVSWWLEKVGLAAQAGQRPDQLSGGQRQRVAIARAMVAGPAMVIADEPTANLDSATAAAILDLLQQINRDTRTTFLIATHDPRVMERAGRILRMRDGRLLGRDSETAHFVEQGAALC